MHSQSRTSLIPSRIRCFVGSLLAIMNVCPLAWAQRVSQTVEVTCRIEPRLQLTINPSTGERIDFGTIYSSETEPTLSKTVPVNLHIFSNLGKPYQVTQEFRSVMTNELGQSLAPEALTVTGEAGTQSAANIATIFSSDPKGQSADPTLSYQLRVPPAQAQGNYRGMLVVTVTAQ